METLLTRHYRAALVIAVIAAVIAWTLYGLQAAGVIS